MRTVDELTQQFRDHGYRVTPQRQVIFRLLEGNATHPTVDALYEAARVELPTISVKTVYQTVHELADLGEVRLVDLGTGSVRVDPNVERDHHHLVCRRCGAVRDFEAEWPALTLPADVRADFAIDAVDVIVRGLCEACAATASPVPNPS